MSASVESSSVVLRDSPISKKIKQDAFSGGQETLEQHRALGGDPDVDVSYQYLRFFLDVSTCLYPKRYSFLLIDYRTTKSLKKSVSGIDQGR